MRFHRLIVVAAALCAITLATPALAADAEDLAEGLRLFTEKGNCQGCHGWAGDGRKMDNQMPTGANLRESQLDRDNLIMTIKCGRPARRCSIGSASRKTSASSRAS